MTEYWVSQKKHWCDYCKCWLNDTPAARAFHERGLRHQQAVKARLREMRKGEESQKQDEKQKSEMMERIEAAAAKQYAKDVELMGAAALPGAEEAAEAAAPLPPPSSVPPSLGCWELQPESKLYYNAKLRFYYDKDRQWYYGGDPPEWTQMPGIPEAAKYDQLSALEKRAAEGSDAAAASTAKGLEEPQTGVSGGLQVVKLKKVVRAAVHPMQAAGGHSMPLTGRIGAAKGVAPQQGGGAAAKGAKRPRDGAATGARGKKLSKEELEHQARRDAARARVAARTAASFGLE